jgi:starch phosphorylase
MQLRHPVEPGAADVHAKVAGLAERLPEPLRPLATVAFNYRWSWDPDGAAVFAAIDQERWRSGGKNPVRLLIEASPQVRARAAVDDDLLERIDGLVQRLRADLARPPWHVVDPARPVAFLCSEFGVHQSLPLYAGGLGVLAGDILKELSDLAVPAVGVGLRYRFGYFHQRLDYSGWQQEYWTESDPYLSAMALVREDGGRPIEVVVPIWGRDVHARVWRVDVGRVPLFLLDADLPVNHPIDRWITGRLYDGHPEVRLAQYALLGVGAVRMFRRLGLDPGLLHLNEGHPTLAALELVAEKVAAGEAFAEAVEEIRRRVVFTTHTPVPAGNETYPADRFLGAVTGLEKRLGLTTDDLLQLARVHSEDPSGEPGMTPIALRLARSTNGVSKRHGDVARHMWNDLYPGPVDAVPITHVTNGVHVPTWTGTAFSDLFDRHLGSDWRERAGDPATWKAIDQIPDADLWEARCAARRTLVTWANERSAEDRVRRGVPFEDIEASATAMDPDVLTVGFARRAASYKRLYLLGINADRAVGLLDDPTPIQMLLGGKAHPSDDGAKGMIRDLFNLRWAPQVVSRVSYLEDYDLEMGALLTMGCDVWLNIPRPPLEASGTSGMKSVLNGGLNVSVLDGWWAEGFDGTNGWGLSGEVDEDHERQDRAHAEELFSVFENEIIPTFYDRDDDGVPTRWVARMRASLKTCAWRFSATRMIRDYVEDVYTA